MKKLLDKIIAKIGKKRREVLAPARGCYNCKHSDKSFDDEPCCYCDKHSEWEASS